MFQEFNPDPWEGLKQTMPEGLAKDDQRIEEEIRFGRLVMLLESGEWERDQHGNVFPAAMSSKDKRAVRQNARRSIVGSTPQFHGDNLNPKFCFWEAVGSVIDGVDVYVPPLKTVANLNMKYSVLIDASINAKE